MSDTGNTPDAPAAAQEDLEHRVQALVEEIEQTTARIEQAAADDAVEAAGPGEVEVGEVGADTQAAPEDEPAEPEPPDSSRTEPTAPPDPVAPPDRAAEAESLSAPDPELAEEPVAAAEQADSGWLPADEPPEPPSPAPASSGPPQSLDALDADLEADLDRLLAAEACAAPGPEGSRQEQGAEPDPELEQELDELLREGDISAPDVEAAASVSGASKLDQQLAGLREDDLEGEPEPQRLEPEEDEQTGATSPAANSPAISAHAASPAPAPGPASAQPPAAGHKAEKPGPDRSLVKAAIIELVDFVRRGGPQVARRVEPVAYQAAVAMNRPLQKRARAKQIVGWLALYTAFLAACVWVYVLFLRPSGPPAGAQERARLVGVGE